MSDTAQQDQHGELWHIEYVHGDRVVRDRDGNCVIQMSKPRDPKVREAQRRLWKHIVACVNGCAGMKPAAYGDVLAALKECVKFVEHVGNYLGHEANCIDAAKAAIAKAEGETTK